VTYELPDIYETRQAKAMLEALQAGDTDRARKIEDHLLAEAADGPEDREALREELRASMLFRAMTDASADGNEPLAQLFQELLTSTCSEKTIKATVAGALLHVGLEQGFLPAANHDFVMQHLAQSDVSDQMKKLASGIERRE
jgi:hypothetical protein